MNEQPDRVAPIAERPRFPEGYGVPEDLLPWSFAEERLVQAQNYWLCTASTSGKPHAAPLWGVWLDNRLFFDGHPHTRWGRNITANPYVSLHLESGSEVVIVEGTIKDIDKPGPELYNRVANAFDTKYSYRLPDHGFFVLYPQVAFGWASFPSNATRWRWEQGF